VAAASAPEPSAPVAGDVPAAAPVAPGGVDVAALRRLWDDVLDAVKQRNRSAHAMLKEYAQVASVDARAVTLSFNNAAIGRNFDTTGKADFFRSALAEVAGIDLQVKVVSDRAPAASGRAAPASAASSRDEPPPQDDVPGPAEAVAPAVVDVTEAVSEGTSLDDEAVDDEAETADVVALVKTGLDATVIGEIDDA
jgi:DNA polymerase-3 subunit gamma/tau